MADLKNYVSQTIHVGNGEWWAEYGLVASGWNEEPPTELHAPLTFAQQDPRWKNELMGGVYQTIGGYGCAMVCACMVYSQGNTDITPREFNAVLNSNAGYNIIGGNEAHLAWDRLPAIFSSLEFVGRRTWTRLLEDVDIQEVYTKIDAHPLILYVDFRPNVAGMQTHFVLATGYTDTDIEIIDPWEGVRVGLMARYGRGGDDTLKRAIWGYRELVVS